MTGREVILTNRSFTPQELYEFMEEYWDKEEYNDFVLGSPTDMSVGMYVMLPATARHLVIVYSRDKGFLNKEKKVVLSVAMTSAGAAEAMARSIPTGGRVIAGIVKLHRTRYGRRNHLFRQDGRIRRKANLPVHQLRSHMKTSFIRW